MKIDLNDKLPLECLITVAKSEINSWRDTAIGTRWRDLQPRAMMHALTLSPKWTKALLEAGVDDRNVLTGALRLAIFSDPIPVILLLAEALKITRNHLIEKMEHKARESILRGGDKYAERIFAKIERLKNIGETTNENNRTYF